jgi:hypothetical protein
VPAPSGASPTHPRPQLTVCHCPATRQQQLIPGEPSGRRYFNPPPPPPALVFLSPPVAPSNFPSFFLPNLGVAAALTRPQICPCRSPAQHFTGAPPPLLLPPPAALGELPHPHHQQTESLSPPIRRRILGSAPRCQDHRRGRAAATAGMLWPAGHLGRKKWPEA